MIDFSNIEYLKTGNPKQIRVYETLKQNKVLEVLSEFDPILTGTIPINIDIENSDLDIICYWKNKTEFISAISSSFENKNYFKIRETIIDQQNL